jgi:IS30 family transposase
MTVQEQIAQIHRQHPDWTSGQIALKIGKCPAHVRDAVKRTGGRLRHKKLTEQEKLAIVTAYKSGEKLMAISAAFGVECSTVSHVARRAGLGRRRYQNQGGA